MDLMFGIAAAGVNLFMVGTILFLENIYSKEKKIQPRAKYFLYLIDYKTIVFGDTIGLSLVNLGVLSSWSNGSGINILISLIFLFISLIISLLAHKVWLSPGHPSSITYPEFGKSNVITALHLSYFFAQVVIGLIGLYLIFTDSLATISWLAVLVGIIIYALSLRADIKDGKI